MAETILFGFSDESFRSNVNLIVVCFSDTNHIWSMQQLLIMN